MLTGGAWSFCFGKRECVLNRYEKLILQFYIVNDIVTVTRLNRIKGAISQTWKFLFIGVDILICSNHQCIDDLDVRY